MNDPISVVLRRGLRRRCPRCGVGPLFHRGIVIRDRCSACHLQFQRNNGDTWFFMIITDRIPILFGIVALYFGFIATTWLGTVAFFLAIATPMIATITHRQGLAIALDYLLRVYLREPTDDVFSSPASAAAARNASTIA